MTIDELRERVHRVNNDFLEGVIFDEGNANNKDRIEYTDAAILAVLDGIRDMGKPPRYENRNDFRGIIEHHVPFDKQIEALKAQIKGDKP